MLSTPRWMRFPGIPRSHVSDSIVEALKGTERDPGLDPEWIRRISFYWEAVRTQYAAFESDLKGPASEVYLHEMPGGQFTNLKEQARSLGLETRWHEVAQAYADVNQMFGDIVKVTPSSKVVGDMALMMVSQDLSVADVKNPDKDIAFPGLGGINDARRSRTAAEGLAQRYPEKGSEGRKAVYRTSRRLCCRRPISKQNARRSKTSWNARSVTRNSPPISCTRRSLPTLPSRTTPMVQRAYLPTHVYFYGLEQEEEVFLDIERGKTLVVRNQAVGEADEKGMRTVFFEMNGQPRRVKVPDQSTRR